MFVSAGGQAFKSWERFLFPCSFFQNTPSFRLFRPAHAGAALKEIHHTDAGFTLRTYTHSTDRQQAEAADMMGSLVAQSL